MNKSGILYLKGVKSTKNPIFHGILNSLILAIVPVILSIFAIEVSGADGSGQDRPNIIFVLADDMGYGDVEILNDESKIPTPHLNRMASSGMIFTDAHSSSSVCTPTRYGLLTGRYNWRSRLQESVTWGWSRKLIEDKRKTVASILQESGYHTSCIGKWHLGMDWTHLTGGIQDDGTNWNSSFRGGWAVDYSKPVANGPISVGFDHFFGISASLDMPPYVYIRNDRPLVTSLVEKAFNRKGPADIDFEAVDVMPRIVYESVRKINLWAPGSKKGDPFFLYVPLAAPHTPIVPTSDWKGRSNLNPYGDFTMQVDAVMGKLLHALERNGVLENTMVIFSTDNGCSPAANLKEMENKGHFANRPWRGHKADIFEGGHRVPFFVHWPARIKPGSVTSRLTCQTDFLATCAEIAGIDHGSDFGEDSFSFVDVLTGGKSDDSDIHGNQRAVVHHSINGSFAIRHGDWKLSLCPDSGGWSNPRPNSKGAKDLPPVQLYNLSTDPTESKNLQAQHPEKVKELYNLLDSYVSMGRSRPGPKSSNTTEVNFLNGIKDASWSP